MHNVNMHVNIDSNKNIMTNILIQGQLCISLYIRKLYTKRTGPRKMEANDFNSQRMKKNVQEDNNYS